MSPIYDDAVGVTPRRCLCDAHVMSHVSQSESCLLSMMMQWVLPLAGVFVMHVYMHMVFMHLCTHVYAHLAVSDSASCLPYSVMSLMYAHIYIRIWLSLIVSHVSHSESCLP
jgi:hypothetical protein